MRLGGLVIGLAALSIGGPAAADAWTRPKGEGLAILKYEDMRADRGFDRSGDLADLPAGRRDRTASIYAEYGLTDRLTVRLKGEWQSGEDAFVDYDGRGPVEIGLNWQVWRDDRTAVALYGGVADGGEGRNAGYAAPGVGERDWEVRAAGGRAFGATFVELQAARRFRDGLPDETRLDATIGAHLGTDWMVLGQAFGGETESGEARWLSLEASVVRNFGVWSVQAGWRNAVAGRETADSSGIVIALWRRF